MIVGVATITLHLPGIRSLKGKRRVVHSIIGRLRHEFNVSVAEVDDQDRWQKATLGVTCVSVSAEYARGLLTRAVSWIENHRPDAPVTNVEIELL